MNYLFLSWVQAAGAGVTGAAGVVSGAFGWCFHCTFHVNHFRVSLSVGLYGNCFVPETPILPAELNVNFDDALFSFANRFLRPCRNGTAA